MAQIFISHSQKDENLINFFLKAFAGTKVKPHLEELEKRSTFGINANNIENNIQLSNAIFVLLSENVENIKQTRDWISWECGVAKNKDIWIFEPDKTLGKIKVIVPYVSHYAISSKTDEWRGYLREIIESYDDSHILPTLSAAVGGGALLNEKDRGSGALAGLAVGAVSLILKRISKPVLGVDIRCHNCFSNYKVHQYGTFRCIVCNSILVLNQPFYPVEQIK